MADVKEESKPSQTYTATSPNAANNKLQDGKRKAEEDPSSPAAPKRAKHIESEEAQDDTEPNSQKEESQLPDDGVEVKAEIATEEPEEADVNDDAEDKDDNDDNEDNEDNDENDEKDEAEDKDKDDKSVKEETTEKKPQPLKRIPFPEKVRRHPLRFPSLQTNCILLACCD